MREIFTSLMLTLFITAGFARQISPTEAESAAADFFLTSGMNLQSLPKALKVKGQKTEAASQPYYIYNAEGDKGFVIISGDDRMKKILGYSDKGRLDADNLPPQLTTLLGQYEGVFEALPAGMAQHPSWRSKTRANDVVLLETALWNQWEPFNLMSPEFDGERGPIGCVATALAIILKYHEYPSKAAKPINHEWYSEGTLYSYDFGKMNIDYSLLKNEYLPDDNLTEEEEKAISELLYASAAAVNMQFSPYASSAWEQDKPHIYREVLGMSPNCQYVARLYFNDDQWNAIIKEQLDNGMPVLYSAKSDYGGHAFVVDGYDSDGYYHVNWGWGGYENGYFSIDGLLDFTKYHGMTINMKPSENPKEDVRRYSSLWIDGGTLLTIDGMGKSVGMHLNISDIEQGEPFSVMAGYLFGWKEFHGFVTIALLDNEGNVVELAKGSGIIPEQELNGMQDEGWTRLGRDIIPFGYLRWNDIFFEGEINNGYRIAMVAKENEEEEWKLVPGTLDAPSFLPVNGNKPANVEMTVRVSGDSSRVKYHFSDDKTLMYGDACYLNVDVVDGIVAVYIDGVLRYHATSYHPLRANFGIENDKYDIELRYIAREDLIERSYVVPETGTLASMIADEDKDRIGTIRISGNINAADLEAAGDLPYLMNIDLEDALFVAEGKNKENFIPEFAFYIYERDFFPPFETIKFPKNLKGFQQISINHANVDALDIPASVDTYEYGCLNESPWWTTLKFVNVRNPVPGKLEEGHLPFYSTVNQVLFVPEGAKEAYQNDSLWSSIFSEIIEVTEDAPYIGEYVEDDNARYIVLTDFAALVGFKGYKETDKVKETVEYKGKSYPVKCVIPRKLNAPQNLIANNQEDFDWNYTTPEIYFSSSLTPKGKNIGWGTYYVVPGASLRSYIYDGMEMYSYEINKANGVLRILPQMDIVEINNIVVNGVETQVNNDGLYYFDSSSIPDVKVNYTIFNEHPMMTDYNREFNAALPDAIITGIGEMSAFEASKYAKVYDMQGVLVYEGILEEASLPEGLYIAVRGKTARTIIFNR